MEKITLEEKLNSLTHYFGAVLSVIGMIMLLVHSAQKSYENIGYFIGCVVFSFSLILLYTISGTYHIMTNPILKHFFRILDHCAIYILIAGTYSPYLLGFFEGINKLIFCFLQIGMVVLGIVFKIYLIGKYDYISILMYLFMGWMIIFVFEDLSNIIPIKSMKYLLYGGISYSLGAIFYLMSNKKFTHSIWHVFVLIGSICHYISIYFLV